MYCTVGGVIISPRDCLQPSRIVQKTKMAQVAHQGLLGTASKTFSIAMLRIIFTFQWCDSHWKTKFPVQKTVLRIFTYMFLWDIDCRLQKQVCLSALVNNTNRCWEIGRSSPGASVLGLATGRVLSTAEAVAIRLLNRFSGLKIIYRYSPALFMHSDSQSREFTEQ